VRDGHRRNGYRRGRLHGLPAGPRPAGRGRGARGGPTSAAGRGRRVSVPSDSQGVVGQSSKNAAAGELERGGARLGHARRAIAPGFEAPPARRSRGRPLLRGQHCLQQPGRRAGLAHAASPRTPQRSLRRHGGGVGGCGLPRPHRPAAAQAPHAGQPRLPGRRRPRHLPGRPPRAPPHRGERPFPSYPGSVSGS
jgi:hypothetical protein